MTHLTRQNALEHLAWKTGQAPQTFVTRSIPLTLVSEVRLPALYHVTLRFQLVSEVRLPALSHIHLRLQLVRSHPFKLQNLGVHSLGRED